MEIPMCYDPVLQAERLAMEQDKRMERTMCCRVCGCTLYPGDKYHQCLKTVVCTSCLEELVESEEVVD